MDYDVKEAGVRIHELIFILNSRFLSFQIGLLLKKPVCVFITTRFNSFFFFKAHNDSGCFIPNENDCGHLPKAQDK